MKGSLPCLKQSHLGSITSPLTPQPRRCLCFLPFTHPKYNSQRCLQFPNSLKTYMPLPTYKTLKKHLVFAICILLPIPPISPSLPSRACFSLNRSLNPARQLHPPLCNYSPAAFTRGEFHLHLRLPQAN